MSRSRRHAFTLVELLVVIGIIAVLIAILMPALSRARAQAQTVQCMSNLRSIGQGLQMYALQNRESLPFGDFLDPVGGWVPQSATANWSIRVAAALNKNALGDNFMLSNTSKGVFKCPSANQDNEAPNEWGAALHLPPAHHALVHHERERADKPPGRALQALEDQGRHRHRADL
jgi:prepilin-type N-terminal cleavage/methylation domain-containing protein